MIKEYAIYLKGTLQKFDINQGNMHLRLDQFIETGRIKDIVEINDSDSTKIKYIKHYVR